MSEVTYFSAGFLFSIFGFSMTVLGMLIPLSFVAVIFFAVEEYRLRGSIKACFNKFNVLCQVNLLGLLIMNSCDFASWFVRTQKTMRGQILLYVTTRIIGTIGITMVLISYVCYIYLRSDVLLWGNKKRIFARVGVGASILLSCAELIISITAIFVNVDEPRLINLPSLLNGVILVILDIFYTYIFTHHVKESNSVFRSATSDKDVIAHYGRFSCVLCFLCLVCYFIYLPLINTGARVTAWSFYALSRLLLTLTMFMMVGMKYKLNQLAAERSRNATTQKSSGLNSKPMTEKSQAMKKNADEETGFETSAATASADTTQTRSTSDTAEPMVKA